MSEIQDQAKKLLERHRVGALVRIFARTPEIAESQVASAFSCAEKLLSYEISGRKIFSRIDLLISSDSKYMDRDCGVSAELLREKVREKFLSPPVFVSEIKKGDMYTMLLNYGIANQMEDRIPYTMILSHHAQSYLSEEVVSKFLSAMFQKARVAGLVTHELKDPIEKGRIANVCSMWHNRSLMTVGGFDLLAGGKKTEEDDMANYGESDVQSIRSGSEEIIPLLRLVKFFGPSIALIHPQNNGKWEDRGMFQDEHSKKRYENRQASREERQEFMAKSIGESLSTLSDGIMLRL